MTGETGEGRGCGQRMDSSVPLDGCEAAEARGTRVSRRREMTTVTSRIRWSWAAFVGPEATTTNTLLALGGGAVGAVAAGALARRRGVGQRLATVTALLALDLVGGAYVNNTRACARWYERPGQGTGEHLWFAAAHVHPMVIALQDRRAVGQGLVMRWALAHYGYLMLSTLVLRLLPAHRRWLGLLATAGGPALDRLLGPSVSAPWFAWAYYPKLLAGHAAAVLWRDDELWGEDPRRMSSGDGAGLLSTAAQFLIRQVA